MMNLKLYVICCFGFCFTFVVNKVSACNGYSLKDVEIVPCDGFTNTIKLTDYGVELTKDCNLITSGCIETKKDINSYSMDYEFYKNNILVRKGTIEDGCKTMDKMSNDFKGMADKLGLPKRCPLKAGKICGGPDKAVSIEKYKLSLPTMVGKISGKYTVRSDAGDSCFKFSNRMVFNGMEAGTSLMKKLPKIGK